MYRSLNRINYLGRILLVIGFTFVVAVPLGLAKQHDPTLEECDAAKNLTAYEIARCEELYRTILPTEGPLPGDPGGGSSGSTDPSCLDQSSSSAVCPSDGGDGSGAGGYGD